jgi:hypothetical protein
MMFYKLGRRKNPHPNPPPYTGEGIIREHTYVESKGVDPLKSVQRRRPRTGYTNREK